MPTRPINIRFPIEDDKSNKFLFRTNKVTKEALKSKLLLLLLTKKGERYYMPDYGTNLEKYIFEPNDTTTEQDINNEIKLTVEKFIPELEISNVTFSQEDENGNVDENALMVNIDFKYNDGIFGQTDRVTIKFKNDI